MDPAGLGLRKQTRDEWHTRLREPLAALDKVLDGELLCIRVGDGLNTLPFGTLADVGSRPAVVKLGVEASIEPEGAEPREPALWVDQVVKLRLDVEGAGVLLPWAAEVSLDLVAHGEECRVS